MRQNPDCILYAQHGWADSSKAIADLAHAVATANMLVVTPDLGWLETWLRIEPLIQRVAEQVSASIEMFPNTGLRVIGHSMGGLIWLELLARNQSWWPQVDSLVLVASPVGGADLARMADPFGWGLGIARDLGINRRSIAETIAQQIPTLSIAGDIDSGSDGTITVGTTQFRFAQTLTLPGLSHVAIRNDPTVVQAIQRFWSGATAPDISAAIIKTLRAIPGITDAHQRDFQRAKVFATFRDGTTMRIWKNPLKVEHVFVADCHGRCLFGGYVGWIHSPGLHETLEAIKKQFG